jgi:hypothetical protein
MKSLLVRRKHVDLDHALTAMSDPTIPTRDTMMMWRKASRRADGPTKELLSRGAKLKRRSMSLA